MTFLSSLLLVLAIVIIISIFVSALALVWHLALPIFVIALIIWLYRRNHHPTSDETYYEEETTYQTFDDGQSRTRKQARDVTTDDVDKSDKE